MKVPGVIYSLLLAIGAWAIDYLTTGEGAGIPWGPIVIAAIPVILKFITVQADQPEVTITSRSMAYDLDGSDEQPSKLRQLLLG